jgi:hypothetical protein
LPRFRARVASPSSSAMSYSSSLNVEQIVLIAGQLAETRVLQQQLDDQHHHHRREQAQLTRLETSHQMRSLFSNSAPPPYPRPTR